MIHGRIKTLLHQAAIEIAKIEKDPSRRLSSEGLDKFEEESADSLDVADVDQAKLEHIKKLMQQSSGIYNHLRKISRNEWDRARNTQWVEHVRVKSTTNSKKRDHGLVEPLLTSRVYENLTKWLPLQRSIQGCVYDLSDLVILEKILNLECAHLIVDVRDWLKKDTPYRLDRAKYFEEIDSKSQHGILFYDHPGKYGAMHQKWVIGYRNQGQKEIKSLVYGSYNFSDNAKKNIESALLFPVLTEGLYNQFQYDFMHLCCQEKYLHTWDTLKREYEINTV